MWELKGRRGSLELLEWSRVVRKQRNAIRVWPWATETNTGFSKQVIFVYHGKNRRRLTEFKGRMENLACLKQTNTNKSPKVI